ncbi:MULTISPECIES: DUF4351 domain-containing protein [unclassified Roseofilum]|uniref:DUF4351 domain-containing protein n=1 Tax=unclassified Roseofilum TaxID=2620099 RepID=UPI000E9331DA|nr:MULTISPECIES: DUF4351 domain-containing protein [unclassified Roseofilum]HBQ99129.1 flagellar assembly protein H [Cyanobacteria bacterium UBA11691]
MSKMIDHDRLFKELLSTFFVEFLELFFPQVIDYIDTQSIILLDKEVFTDVTEGEKHESDLIAQVKFRGKPSYFLIHVEAQASSQKDFERRMFVYFSRLHEKFALPVYPIVIFSYNIPLKEAKNKYQVTFPDLKVLEFKYQVVQLNRLNWRDFLNQPNPIASALMAKMRIDPQDRPKVKAQCLRLLTTLKLDPARMQLISGFVDTYLKLNTSEEIKFEQEISTFTQPEQEAGMEIITSWMEKGIERGIDQGLMREKELIIRLIKRKLGEIDSELETEIKALEIDRVEALGEALLDFNCVDDLIAWFNQM